MDAENGLVIKGTEPPIALLGMNDCWNRIGVMGDRSCGELKAVIHCRNCAVYSAAGRGLLERDAPADYLNEWTEVLSKTTVEAADSQTTGAMVRSAKTISVMIFRLGGEWLALPVRLLQEVTSPCVIHTLPHRSDTLFLGLVNIRGEILLCIALNHLLALDAATNNALAANALAAKRMVVIAKEEQKWVFTVDEVAGIHRFHPRELQETPVVIAKAGEAYTKGVISWQGHQVNYLDSDLLFYTLNRRIL